MFVNLLMTRTYWKRCCTMLKGNITVHIRNPIALEEIFRLQMEGEVYYFSRSGFSALNSEHFHSNLHMRKRNTWEFPSADTNSYDYLIFQTLLSQIPRFLQPLSDHRQKRNIVNIETIPFFTFPWKNKTNKNTPSVLFYVQKRDIIGDQLNLSNAELERRQACSHDSMSNTLELNPFFKVSISSMR